MTPTSDRVQIRIPASSANLGPGFDVLAVALSLHSNLTAARSESRTFQFHGDWDPRWDKVLVGMTDVIEDLFYQTTGLERIPISYTLENHVPVARGLGSSAVIRVGLLKVLNSLNKNPLDTEEMLSLAVRLEGSPDNASATMLGGLTVSGFVGGRLRYLRCPITKDLRFVAMVPTAEVTTDQARSIFPKDIGRDDAIGNASRLALIIAALTQGQYELLQDLFDDVFHQPQRERHYPELRALSAVTSAAREAGAFGAYLSGSGSTMMAVTLRRPEEVGAAMAEAFNAKSSDTGFSCQILNLCCDNEGTVLTEDN
ncbi:MAG: homoserine kinase [bacterium]